MLVYKTPDDQTSFYFCSQILHHTPSYHVSHTSLLSDPQIYHANYYPRAFAHASPSA